MLKIHHLGLETASPILLESSTTLEVVNSIILIELTGMSIAALIGESNPLRARLIPNKLYNMEMT